MTLLLTLWLLAGHRQVIRTSMPNGIAMVVTCKKMKLLTLYGDERMVIPLANPVWADTTGLVSFVVPKSGCYKVITQSK